MRAIGIGLWMAVWLLGCGGDDDTSADAAGEADLAEAGDGVGDTGDEAETTVEAETTGDGTADEYVAPPVAQPLCEGGSGSVTRRRWQDPVSGFEYCGAPCHGCEAVCQAVGTADEGWYAVCTDTTVDAGCGEVPGLIVRSTCP